MANGRHAIKLALPDKNEHGRDFVATLYILAVPGMFGYPTTTDVKNNATT